MRSNNISNEWVLLLDVGVCAGHWRFFIVLSVLLFSHYFEFIFGNCKWIWVFAQIILNWKTMNYFNLEARMENTKYSYCFFFFSKHNWIDFNEFSSNLTWFTHISSEWKLDSECCMHSTIIIHNVSRKSDSRHYNGESENENINYWVFFIIGNGIRDGRKNISVYCSLLFVFASELVFPFFGADINQVKP